MRWLSRLVTASIAAAVVAAIGFAIYDAARPKHVGGRFVTSALFRDASGLPVGSRVLIAGVTVGNIESLAIEGNAARVGLRLADHVVIWDDGWATKKSSSALGDNYVEILPGGPDPGDPVSAARPRRRLRSGEPIPRVVEASSTDAVMRSIDQAIPKFNQQLGSADQFLHEAREWVSGPFHRRVTDLDQQLAAGAIARPLRRVEGYTADFDRWTAELAATVGRELPRFERGLREWPGAIAAVTGDLRGAHTDLSQALGSARQGMDELDPYIDDAGDWIAELTEAPEQRRGRLAEMIHDPKLADDVESATESVKALTSTINQLKTVIGFRAEQNFFSGLPRFYVTAEVAGRADQFYLIEAEKGPTGDNPAVALTDVPGSNRYVWTSTVSERLRFTAQWGRRFGPLSLRVGVKESQFGAGADFLVNRGRLKLSVDAMESSFDRAPRVKVAAALAVFRSLYVLAGVDDAFTDGGYLPIQPWNEQLQPVQFEELRYGRDYFLGFELRIHDADINRLLLIYGGLLATMLSG